MYYKYISLLTFCFSICYSCTYVCLGDKAKCYEPEDTTRMMLVNKTETEIICIDSKSQKDYVCGSAVELHFELNVNNVTTKCYLAKTYWGGYYYFEYVKPLVVGKEYSIIFNDDHTFCNLVTPVRDSNYCASIPQNYLSSNDNDLFVYIFIGSIIGLLVLTMIICLIKYRCTNKIRQRAESAYPQHEI